MSKRMTLGISASILTIFVGFCAYLFLIPGEPPKFDAYMKGHEALNMGQYDVAEEILEPLAKDGDKRAQDYLSLMAALGLGKPIDRTEAFYWIAKEEGRGFAECYIARYWATDTFDVQDFNEAAFWVIAANEAHKEDFCIRLLEEEGVDNAAIQEIQEKLGE